VVDLLSLLGRSRDENLHSDVIALLLTPSFAPNISGPFLKGLLAHAAQERREDALSALDGKGGSAYVSIRREYLLPEGRRIDILAHRPGLVLAIESKTDTFEHDDQTSAYYHWMKRAAPLAFGLFLTPAGLSAGSRRFVPISYLDLAALLVDATGGTSPCEDEQAVAAAYLKCLAAGMIRTEFAALGLCPVARKGA
jgi:hypothetical protein